MTSIMPFNNFLNKFNSPWKTFLKNVNSSWGIVLLMVYILASASTHIRKIFIYHTHVTSILIKIRYIMRWIIFLGVGGSRQRGRMHVVIHSRCAQCGKLSIVWWDMMGYTNVRIMWNQNLSPHCFMTCSDTDCAMVQGHTRFQLCLYFF